MFCTFHLYFAFLAANAALSVTMSASLQQKLSIAIVHKTLSIAIVNLKINNCNNVMLIVMVAIVVVP